MYVKQYFQFETMLKSIKGRYHIICCNICILFINFFLLQSYKCILKKAGRKRWAAGQTSSNPHMIVPHYCLFLSSKELIGDFF